jgi:hypothetical protein
MTGIRLTAQHSPMAWLLYFTKLTVSIDGNAQTLGWGTHVFPTSAGIHELQVTCGYLGSPRWPATLKVPVTEGQETRVSYSTPPWMFAQGKMSIRTDA